MAKSVFLSYCHKQGQWVEACLAPVLKAAGCEVFVDVERFKGDFGLVPQMDAWQDQADVSLLVLSPDYLASAHCKHEMDRAIAADPSFARGKVLAVPRVSCDMSAFSRRPVAPVWIDLCDDRDAGQWRQLLETVEAKELRCRATDWLAARDEIVLKFRDQAQSVNLVICGFPKWKPMLFQDGNERCTWLPELNVVNLDDPATITRDGLVQRILEVCGGNPDVKPPPRDLQALNGLLGRSRPVQLALLRFEHVRDRSQEYGVDLFHTLRHLIERRAVVLLIESRIGFRELVPADHPLSNLNLHTVELRES